MNTYKISSSLNGRDFKGTKAEARRCGAEFISDTAFKIDAEGEAKFGFTILLREEYVVRVGAASAVNPAPATAAQPTPYAPPKWRGTRSMEGWSDF